MTKNMKTTTIEFTRVNNDVNGNPRYVCHFFNLLRDEEVNQSNKSFNSKLGLSERYKIAVKRANKIGGRKFHNKQYGGGIVFQSYNIERLESDILDLVNNGEVYPVMGDFNENGDNI